MAAKTLSLHELLKMFIRHEDLVLTYTTGKKSEAKSILCTTNFRVKYIKKYRRKFGNRAKDHVRVWSWTDNKFLEIPVSSIQANSIKPLSEILNNGPIEQ